MQYARVDEEDLLTYRYMLLEEGVMLPVSDVDTLNRQLDEVIRSVAAAFSGESIRVDKFREYWLAKQKNKTTVDVRDLEPTWMMVKYADGDALHPSLYLGHSKAENCVLKKLLLYGVPPEYEISSMMLTDEIEAALYQLKYGKTIYRMLSKTSQRRTPENVDMIAHRCVYFRQLPDVRTFVTVDNVNWLEGLRRPLNSIDDMTEEHPLWWKHFPSKRDEKKKSTLAGLPIMHEPATEASLTILKTQLNKYFAECPENKSVNDCVAVSRKSVYFSLDDAWKIIMRRRENNRWNVCFIKNSPIHTTICKIVEGIYAKNVFINLAVHRLRQASQNTFAYRILTEHQDRYIEGRKMKLKLILFSRRVFEKVHIIQSFSPERRVVPSTSGSAVLPSKRSFSSSVEPHSSEASSEPSAPKKHKMDDTGKCKANEDLSDPNSYLTAFEVPALSPATISYVQPSSPIVPSHLLDPSDSHIAPSSPSAESGGVTSRRFSDDDAAKVLLSLKKNAEERKTT